MATRIDHLEINGRSIGPGHPTYIVAEMSANHGQDFDEAVNILKAAKASGADAIKLQTYTADTLTLDSNQEPFRIKGTLWDGARLHRLYRTAATPWVWHPWLQEMAAVIGLDIFSSPFDATAVDFLESLAMPAYKIASFEIVDLPLLRRTAATRKPIILSTGMATVEEITEAVATIRAAGGEQIALLKCTSAYPSPPGAMNLKTIPDLGKRFGVPVGLSDHSLSEAVPVTAVALGACIVEKHLTMSRDTPGPDSAFSLEPAEFASMAAAIRTTEQALGGVHYGPDETEVDSLKFRRSLFVVRDIPAGEILSAANVRSIRPANGLHTRHLDSVLGRKAVCAIQSGTPLAWEHIEST